VVEACNLATKAKTGGGPKPIGPKAKGCCDTGGGPASAAPGLLVLLFLLRRRRAHVG
jgi:uncharacterized protein (TIGR03382 family)